MIAIFLSLRSWFLSIDRGIPVSFLKSCLEDSQVSRRKKNVWFA